MSPLPISVILPDGLFEKRQEACALSCLSSVSAGSCTAQDASCLCPSYSWGTSILSCVQSTCETEDVLHSAYEELLTYCLLSDVTFTLPEPSFTLSSASTATASASITGSASVAASTTTTAGASTTSSEAVTTGTPVNVSAIMAGLCSLFFGIALIFGYIGVREKLRQDKPHGEPCPRGNWPRGPDLPEEKGRKLASSPKDGNNSSEGQSQRTGQPETSSAGGISTFVSSLGPEESYSEMDVDIEGRREKLRQVRLERAEAAEVIRRENLIHIFTTVPTLDNPSPTSTTSSASVASPNAYRLPVGQDVDKDDKKPSLAFTAFDEKEEAEEEGQYRLEHQDQGQEHGGEDEAEAQYVVIPSARDSTILYPFTSTSVQSTDTENDAEHHPRASERNLWFTNKPNSTVDRQ